MILSSRVGCHFDSIIKVTDGKGLVIMKKLTLKIIIAINYSYKSEFSSVFKFI